MPMYNLIEFSKNCTKKSGSLWNYYRDDPNSTTADNYNADPIINSVSFIYKDSSKGEMSNNGNDNNNVIEKIEIVVALNHLSNLWRTLNMPLINCEVSLTLTWSKNYASTDLIKRAANPNVNSPVAAIAPQTEKTFKIPDTILYVPFIALSTENDSKLSDKKRDRS